MWHASDILEIKSTNALPNPALQVTRNTMFDQWLGAVKQGGAGGAQEQAEGSGGKKESDQGGSTSQAGGMNGSGSDQDWRPLNEVAEYLASAPAAGGACCPHHGHPHPHTSQHPQQQVTWAAAIPGDAGGGGGPSSSSAAETTAGPAAPPPVAPLPLDASGTFRPGWEDIFRMNQKQLEAAIHRVSNDASLEPGRKAYLIQNIMVSSGQGEGGFCLKLVVSLPLFLLSPSPASIRAAP